MSRTHTRRNVVRYAAGAGLSAGLASRRVPVLAQDAAPTPTPVSVGQGNVPITMWVQDFGPIVGYFERAARAYVEKQGEDAVSVTVQATPYDDLLAKVLPSVAGGNEADIIMGYTNWYVATDITRLFLPLGEYMGGRAELERIAYPSAFTVLQMPGDEVYYVPYAAGLRGGATTVNVGQWTEQGIDYRALETWDDVEAAGEALTIRDGDAITRAGLSPIGGFDNLVMIKSWIWQQGGEFYDPESGVWSLASAEGEAAMQRFYDLFWTKRTSSFDLVTMDSEFDDFNRGAIATNANGAWTVSAHEAGNPELEVDAVPKPMLAGAVNEVYYPDHIAVITLSRRLVENEEKLGHAIGILNELLSPDTLLGMTETYSGTLINSTLYADPRIEETAFGPLSKRIADGVWPRSRFPGDRVANQGPAVEELERALRQEITIAEALANADAYLNSQEQQARQRLGL